MWEDRRNINGGSWTFRVPKVNGPDFWTRVQLMAIGEKLQGCLDTGKISLESLENIHKKANSGLRRVVIKSNAVLRGFGTLRNQY